MLGADFEGARVESPDSAAGSGGAAGSSSGGSSTGGVAGTGAIAGSGGAIEDASSDIVDAAVHCPNEVYVSIAGNDANSGCDKEHPKRTIAAGLEVARSQQSVAVIWVCVGTYDEAITIDIPVDVRGGYDCQTWNKVADDASVGSKVETIVGGSKLPQAIRITGTAVDASTLVDGLTVLGASGPDQDGGIADGGLDGAPPLLDGAAMRIDSGAMPVVTDCRIRGGNTISIAAEGSIGLRVDSGAAPEISKNEIDGGRGVTYSLAGFGRVGVYVEDAAPSLHDNVITGGDSAPLLSYGIGSAGVVLKNTLPMTASNSKSILRNSIEGGASKGQIVGISSAGVMISGNSDVDLVENAIRPGKSLGVAVELRGVQSSSSGTVRLLSNRVYGGDLSNPNDPNLGFRVAVWIDTAKSFVAENNMLYGGVPIVGFAGGSPSFGLAIGSTNGAVVRHNTIYSGPSGYPTVGTAIKIHHGTTGALVQNNILIADGGWNESFFVDPCASSGVFARLENNLIMNAGKSSSAAINQLYGYNANTPDDPNCYAFKGLSTIAEVETHLLAACGALTDGPCKSFGGVKTSGNRTLRASCGTDAGCIPWAACDIDPLTCLQSIFDAWSVSDNGLDTMFGPGWKLKPGVPCAIAKSSLDLALGVDLFGIGRTKPPSMGAVEHDGACTP